VLGSVGFFDDKSFSHQRIGMSPPPPGGGVVGVDVGMGSVHCGRQVKLTSALPGATSLSGHFWR
jgi:hypothetical protein